MEFFASLLSSCSTGILLIFADGRLPFLFVSRSKFSAAEAGAALRAPRHLAELNRAACVRASRLFSLFPLLVFPPVSIASVL